MLTSVCWSALFFLVALPLPAASAADAPPAGTVIHLQGAALVSHAEASDNLAPGMPILVGDRIVTGSNARVGLKMVDGAVLSLGANTEFGINDYRYSKRAGKGTARLELIKGVFRAVTGAIGKLKERDFQVQTAMGAIGIRGTDFWGGFYFSPALDVALLGGKGIYVENSAGRVEVTAPGNGTTVQGAGVAPTPPARWGDKKLNAAKQSVAWDGDGAATR